MLETVTGPLRGVAPLHAMPDSTDHILVNRLPLTEQASWYTYHQSQLLSFNFRVPPHMAQATHLYACLTYRYMPASPDQALEWCHGHVEHKHKPTTN